MSELAAGAAAPSFTLPSDGGATVSLADYHGKKLVFAFTRAPIPVRTTFLIDLDGKIAANGPK